MLVVGGVLPLLLVPVLLVLLPESVRYLVTMGKKLDRVAAALRRIDRNADLRDATFMVPPRTQAGSPVWHLFRPELLRGTLLLWFAFFMSLLVIYLLSSWLPTVLRGTGISLKHAALVTAMFQVGGTVGAIVLGWLMDRLNPHHVLAASYTLAGLFTAVIGNVTASPVLAAVAVFWAGFCVSGSQVGANALSAAYYPTDCRATGVSWANGVGRIGSVVGSVGGGAMLSLGLGMPALFVLVGIPAVLAGLTMLVLGRGHTAARPALPAVQG